MKRETVLTLIMAVSGVAFGAVGMSVGYHFVTDEQTEAGRTCADMFPESSGCGPYQPYIGLAVASIAWIGIMMWVAYQFFPERREDD